MNLFRSDLWALWVACAAMLAAGAINLRTLKVPNRLTLPTILLGWLAALLVTFSALPSAGGGLLTSLVVAIFASLLLTPVKTAGWIGAGCVKMHAGFGAWVGCAVGFWAAVLLVLASTVLGMLLTVLFSWLVHVRNRGKPKSGTWLFPIQATLSLGAILCVLEAAWLGWV